MKWKKEVPTKSGWYWFKFDPEKWPNLPGNVGDPMMMMVYEHDGVFYYEDTVNRETYRVTEPKALWAGPLQPPQDESGSQSRTQGEER